METYSFSEEALKDAIASAKATHSDATAKAQGAEAQGAEAQGAEAQRLGFDPSKGGGMQEGNMEIMAQCISVKTANNKICIKLPVVGTRCLTVPVNIPNGKVGKACLSVCTIFGVPSGVKVSITIGGVTVIRQSFGVGC
jgi:hypothetical protein